ncbi:MAG: 30S ribosomal protein S2, partial [Alphaproteobacteria bacterium]|nr:30S ribosomal protein S2 [Alphaproteobacteria bacterium]
IPDIMFVIDTNKEAIAILEARKLNIPIIAILDTNSDPDGITYPIPGNDDAARAIQTYCDLIADAVLDGLAAGAASSGVDLGASENPDEPMLREAKAPKAKAEADAVPAEAAAVAEEMIAAAEPAAKPAAAEAAAEVAEPAVADEAAQAATSEANDAVETEKAAV